MSKQKKKLVIAITGASGALYPKLFLDFLRDHPEIHCDVVASKNAHVVFQKETGSPLTEAWPKINDPSDFYVPYASGSALYDAMIILPCSMGTLGRIANGISNDAITRAADVFLKERRQLIVVPRETPFNLIHLRNMTTLAEAGATILPAIPSFYSHQETIEEAVNSVIGRVLDHLKIENDLLHRWMDKGTAS